MIGGSGLEIAIANDVGFAIWSSPSSSWFIRHGRSRRDDRKT
jgi:hypothetical protein